jgi:hypothetical protein
MAPIPFVALTKLSRIWMPPSLSELRVAGSIQGLSETSSAGYELLAIGKPPPTLL